MGPFIFPTGLPFMPQLLALEAGFGSTFPTLDLSRSARINGTMVAAFSEAVSSIIFG
jgi:hypothetical protein